MFVMLPSLLLSFLSKFIDNGETILDIIECYYTNLNVHKPLHSNALYIFMLDDSLMFYSIT